MPAVVRRTLARCVLGLLIAIPCFVAVLAFALALPLDARITASLKRAIDDGLLTPDIQGQLSEYGQGGHKFDMFSECLGLGINLGNTDRTVFYRTIATPYISPEVSTFAGKAHHAPCKDLIKAVETGPNAGFVYFRFWHGSQVYMRLMLPLLGLGGMRILNALLLYGAILSFCFGLRDWFGWLAVPIFLLPNAIFSDLLSAPLVTVQALPLACTYFTLAVAIRILERHRGVSEDLFVFAFLSGAAYNFVSMLFTPQLVPAWLAFLCLAASIRWSGSGVRSLQTIGLAFGIAAAWFSGFVLTWISKWALSVILLGRSAVINGVSIAASGSNYAVRDLSSIHLPFLLTLMVLGWSHIRLIFLSFALSGAVLIVRKRKGRLAAQETEEWLLLQLPSVIVIGWTEIMRYHSVQHFVFARRALLLLAILPLMALLSPGRRPMQDPEADAPCPTADSTSLRITRGEWPTS